jgi:hypothetical protein
MRQDIERLFRDSIAASGWAGDIGFSTQPAFATSPLAGLTPKLGISA